MRQRQGRGILEGPFAALHAAEPTLFRAAHRRPGAAARRWGVVQLVGHLTVNEDGEGSNPSAPANLSSRLKCSHDMAAGRCDRRSVAGAARSLAFRTSRKTLPSPDFPIRERNQQKKRRESWNRVLQTLDIKRARGNSEQSGDAQPG